MKILLVKAVSAFFLLSMLTSCLGGGDSYTEATADFAYIMDDDIEGKYAMTSQAGYVKSENIDKLNLEVGRAYYVNYKAIFKGGAAFASAEKFELARKEPIPQADFSIGKPYGGAPSHLVKDSINPNSVEIGIWSAYGSVIEDNWVIKYTTSKKEDDKIDVYFCYDREGQEENGKKLGDNQAIIDIRFIKSEKSGNVEEEKNEQLDAISSLKDFRKIFRPVYDESGTANVLLKFRYVRKTDNRPTVDYIGSFYTSGTQSLYFMTFVEER